MKVGPVNLMPFVDDYEQLNAEQFDGRLRSVIKNKKESDPKKLVKKEQRIIHSFVQLPCRVSFVPSRLGKIPSTHKNTIFMEYDNFLRLLSNYLPDTLSDNDDFKRYLQTHLLLDGFADQFVLQLPKPRSSFYLKKFDQVMEGVGSHLSFAEDSLGYFPINVDAFILQDMKLLEISITFLQLIFNLIMLLLFSISVLLVYSLLMFSVESKSFDLGVMRMVGLSKNNVIVLIIVQSFMFVVPSIIFGVSFSLVILRVAKHFAENSLHIDFEAVPSLGSFAQALTLSTLIPLISSIMPIQIVLQRNLNDALDIQRSKT